MTFRERFVPSDPRGVGDEPDYRFTLANERTFLAWIRTALALAGRRAGRGRDCSRTWWEANSSGSCCWC